MTNISAHQLEKQMQIKLLCPRGTQTCALAVANIAHAVRLTEMEKWSWIRIRNPISTKI